MLWAMALLAALGIVCAIIISVEEDISERKYGNGKKARPDQQK